MTLIINATMAMQSLREITRDNESKVYDRVGGACLYVRDGSPDCGVGRAMAWLGVPVSSLLSVDMGPFDGGIATAQFPDVYLTTYARRIYTAFQEAQDNEAPWQEALSAAESAYRHPMGTGLPMW